VKPQGLKGLFEPKICRLSSPHIQGEFGFRKTTVRTFIVPLLSYAQGRCRHRQAAFFYTQRRMNGTCERGKGNPQARGVIIEELRSRWLSLLLVGVTMLTGAAVSLLQPFFYKSLFDEAIPSADTPMILWLLLAMVITPIAAIGLAKRTGLPARPNRRIRVAGASGTALRSSRPAEDTGDGQADPRRGLSTDHRECRQNRRALHRAGAAPLDISHDHPGRNARCDARPQPGARRNLVCGHPHHVGRHLETEPDLERTRSRNAETSGERCRPHRGCFWKDSERSRRIWAKNGKGEGGSTKTSCSNYGRLHYIICL